MDSKIVPANTREMGHRIMNAVRELEPGAAVILYGSRARGDETPESDWDVLVLVDEPVDSKREDAIIHRLYSLALETDTVISAIVHSQREWQSPLSQAIPFHQHVNEEGITL